MATKNCIKEYVIVDVRDFPIDKYDINKTQRTDPLRLCFRGKWFKIRRVIDKRRAASTKAGGIGMRYKILVEDTEAERIWETYLFEEERSWFVEVTE